MKNKKIPKELADDLVPNSIYKYAWSDLQLGNPDQALKNLERIYNLSKNSNSKGYKRLGKPVLSDIVLIYNRTKKPAKAAEDYLADNLGITKKDMPKYLKAIAYQYSDDGQIKSSAFLFRRLIQLSPTSKQALDYQEEIVKLHRHSNNKLFLAELNRYIKDYSKGSAWYKANLKHKNLVAKSNKSREALLRNYILNNHQLYQKSKTASSKANILNAYPIYLKEFSKLKEAPTMHFYYAELMYDLKNYNKAVKHYMWIADNAPGSKHFEPSMLNALLATDELLKKSNSSAKRTKSLEKVPYNETETNLCRSCKEIYEYI